MGYFCVAQECGARMPVGGVPGPGSVGPGVWGARMLRECEVPGCSGSVGCPDAPGVWGARMLRECGVPELGQGAGQLG